MTFSEEPKQTQQEAKAPILSSILLKSPSVTPVQTQKNPYMDSEAGSPKTGCAGAAVKEGRAPS
jgi:hypothetical protein